MPRVTIHMPTYNQGRFVAHALRGALSQTYDDYEVIVSDNHSTDETAAVLASFAGHPKLRVVKPPSFLPVVDHFKWAVAQSRSELFSYLCSDDGLLPGFLAAQVELLDRHPNVAFSHTAAEMIDGDGRVMYLEKSIRKTGVTPGREAIKRFIRNPFGVGDSVLFRRAKFDEVGGFGGLYALDWEIGFLLCTVGDLGYRQEVLMQYRFWEGPERTIPNRLRFMEAVNQFYDTYEPRFPQYRRLFQRARLIKALGSIEGLEGMTDAQRQQALTHLRHLCRHPLVEAKLKAFELGLGPVFVKAAALKLEGKRKVKSLLWPLLAPLRPTPAGGASGPADARAATRRS